MIDTARRRRATMVTASAATTGTVRWSIAGSTVALAQTATDLDQHGHSHRLVDMSQLQYNGTTSIFL